MAVLTTAATTIGARPARPSRSMTSVTKNTPAIGVLNTLNSCCLAEKRGHLSWRKMKQFGQLRTDDASNRRNRTFWARRPSSGNCGRRSQPCASLQGLAAAIAIDAPHDTKNCLCLHRGCEAVHTANQKPSLPRRERQSATKRLDWRPAQKQQSRIQWGE